MTKKQSLPFEVGQTAEAKSFEEGFRSAWFKCKIRKIIKKKGQIMHALEYFDFPEEEVDLINIFQKPPKSSGNAKNVKRELMLRPKFPPIYHENDLPDLNTISEVIVVVDGVWRVGDLVDWWKDDCYWSGTVTEIEGDDKIKITLPKKPIGEGSSYYVSSKDLRPSLNWSPEAGWTLPRSLGSQSGHSCVRLIHPVKPGGDKQKVKSTPRSSLEYNESISSHTSTNSLPPLDSSMHSKGLMKQSNDISKKEMQPTDRMNGDLCVEGSAIGKPSSSGSVSSTYVRDVPAEASGATSVEEQHYDNGSSKKMRVGETILLNSTASDSLESTIIDMEELVNRVKWLRRILKFGISSNTVGPTWKFLEQPAVPTPK